MGLIDRIIHKESRGRSTAKNPRSTATGPGQFLNSTWLNMMRRYEPAMTSNRSNAEILALRTDPVLSAKMVERYAAESAAFLQARGLPVNDGTIYLAHHLGWLGAETVLRANPNTPMSSLVSAKVLAANPHLKNMTAGRMIQWTAQSVAVDDLGGSGPLVQASPSAAGQADPFANPTPYYNLPEYQNGMAGALASYQPPTAPAAKLPAAYAPANDPFGAQAVVDLYKSTTPENWSNNSGLITRELFAMRERINELKKSDPSLTPEAINGIFIGMINNSPDAAAVRGVLTRFPHLQTPLVMALSGNTTGRTPEQNKAAADAAKTMMADFMAGKPVAAPKTSASGTAASASGPAPTASSRPAPDRPVGWADVVTSPTRLTDSAATFSSEPNAGLKANPAWASWSAAKAAGQPVGGSPLKLMTTYQPPAGPQPTNPAAGGMLNPAWTDWSNLTSEKIPAAPPKYLTQPTSLQYAMGFTPTPTTRQPPTVTVGAPGGGAAPAMSGNQQLAANPNTLGRTVGRITQSDGSYIIPRSFNASSSDPKERAIPAGGGSGYTITMKKDPASGKTTGTYVNNAGRTITYTI